MVRPGLRNEKKKIVVVPGGRRKLHLYKHKHVKPRCASCGSLLQGVPRDVREFRKLSKSQKRPERKFGGYLCHKCTERLIRDKVRYSE